MTFKKAFLFGLKDLSLNDLLNGFYFKNYPHWFNVFLVVLSEFHQKHTKLS